MPEAGGHNLKLRALLLRLKLGIPLIQPDPDLTDRTMVTLRFHQLPLLVVAALYFVPPTRVSAVCPGSPRCGFLNLGGAKHSGTPGTNSCKEVCVYLPLLHKGLSCGGCAVAVPAPVPVPPPPPSAYNIFLDTAGIPPSDLAAFTAANALWESVITGDLPDVPSSTLPNQFPCGCPGCAYPVVIDDLYYCVLYQALGGKNPDGSQTLGHAQAINSHMESGLPVTGIMTINTDAFGIPNYAQIRDPFLKHEIGHMIGKIWRVQWIILQ
jgi:hypothetical protein